jgi:membrane protein DedA with SNARE-associated domain
MTEPSVGIPVLDYFLALLGEYGYLITFAFAIVENIFIMGSIIPGETVQVAAGFVSASGVIDPFIVWLFAFSGSFLGGNVSYLLGRRGGRPMLDRYAHVPWMRDRVLGAEAYFEKHGNKTVFMARWVAGFKNFVPAIAGMTKMNFWWFQLYSFLGALFYTGMLVLLGYFFGQYLTLVVDVVQGSGWVALGIVVLIAGYTWYRIRQRRKCEEAADEYEAAHPEDAETSAPTPAPESASVANASANPGDEDGP